MADVDINKFRASVVRDGSKPSSPGFIVSEGQDPVNPPGTNNYVPYSGATANVELGEYGVEAGFITLDTTPTNTPTDQGTIFWDADDETVDIVLNGYTMKIGEDLFYPVKNQTGSTIAKGVAVRFNGTVGASGRLLIAPFIADGSVPSTRFMGVTAEEILNGEDGKVLYFGRIRGINTNAFNEGDILYASTTVAGGFQTSIPVAPNNIVLVAAVVTKSINQGTIFVRPTLASNLNTDEAVKITTVANLDLLQYQSGTGLWENKTLAQILGGTASQFVKGNGSLDSNTYLTTSAAASTYVPYTGSTSNVDLGIYTLSSNNLIANGGFNSGALFLKQSNNAQTINLDYTTITPIGTNQLNFGFSQSSGVWKSFVLNAINLTNNTNRTYTLPDASGTIALVGGAGVGTVTSVGLSSATSGVTIGSTPVTSSGTITLAIATASGSQNGLLSSTDWTTFNNKQNALGYVPVPETRTITINGTTQDLSANRTFNVGDMLLDTIQTVTARKDYNNNTLHLVVNGTSQKTILTNSPIDIGSYSGLINAFGFNASNNLYFSKGANNNGIFAFNNAATRTYTLKDASGTLAFTSDIPANPVGGTGTTNYLPKFTGSTTIGNSIVTDNGSVVSVINGTLALSNAFNLTGRNAANTINIALIGRNSSDRVIIDADGYGTNIGGGGTVLLNPTGGNVGIGGTNTDSLLTINGTAGTTHERFREGSTTIGFIGGANGLITGQSGKLTVRAEAGLVLSSQGNSPDVLITSGNLLVGATSDNGARLQVSGTATFSSSVTSNATTSVSFYSGTYVSNSLGDGSFATYSGRIRENLSYGLNIDLYDRNAATWRTPLSFNNTGGAATFSSGIATNGYTASTSYAALFNGNVGIGTPSPNATLQVRGDNGTSVSAVLRLRDTNSTSRTTRLQFEDYNGTLADGIIDFKIPTAGSATGARLDIGVDSAIMSLVRGGNVLIGTTTDAGYKLDVNGTGRFSGRLLVSHATSGNYGAVIYNTSATGEGLVVRGGSTSSHSAFVVQPYDGSVSLFNVLATGAATFSSGIATNGYTASTSYAALFNGSVGIGTSIPNSVLHVFGNLSNNPARFEGNSSSNAWVQWKAGATASSWQLGASSGAFIFYDDLQAAERMRITSGGEVLIGNTDNGAYNLQCNGTGVWGAGAYVNGSDRNIKDNIATIEKGLEYIQKMNPVKFRYKPNYTRDHSMQTGFIAQELQEVFASEDYLSGLVQQGVHLSVAYQNLLPVLVKAIQELNQKFDTLKN